MREISQQKGKDYLKSVKKWVLNRPLLGFAVKSFGDAYDISYVATKIGGQQFDLSFKLMEGDSAKKIIYLECKFRNEETGNINSEFKKFIKTVYDAILGCDDKEQLANAEFLFVSNIPPDEWRKYLNNKTGFLREIISNEHKKEITEAAIQKLVTSFHILVLSQTILEGKS